MSKSKEEWRQHHRDLHIMHQNIERHSEQADNLAVSAGGTPQEASADGLQEDWRSKVKDMRGSLTKSRSRLKKRGRDVFR